MYTSGNVEQEEYFGFSGSFFNKYPIIIDDITKRKLINIKRSLLLSIDEKHLMNQICDDEDENGDDK